MKYLTLIGLFVVCALNAQVQTVTMDTQRARHAVEDLSANDAILVDSVAAHRTDIDLNADSVTALRADIGSAEVSITDTAVYTNYTVAKSDSGLYTADGYATMWDVNELIGQAFKEYLFNAEYDTIWDAMTTKPTIATALAQNTLVQTLVDSGYWARMDYLLIPATDYEDGALINWPSPGTYDADNVSSTAWDALEGYTGDGVADYISTNFNPSTDGVNYTVSDAAWGIYTRSNTGGSTYLFLVDDSGKKIGLNPDNGSAISYSYVNDDSYMDIAYTTASHGMWIGIRPDNANHSIHHFGGGDAGVLLDEGELSPVIPNDEIDIFYQEVGASYDNRQFSIFFMMDALTHGEAIGINGIFETYMDAIGKGVQ